MRYWVVAVWSFLVVAGCSRPSARVVLYSAQDREFAESVLEDFTKISGWPVATKFDTEAAKSVGLAMELSLDARRPRCDVHWNNEIIGTIRLARQGVYEAYSSPSAEPFPTSCRPSDGLWTAFAARARVLIVNTRLIAEMDRPKSILDLTDPRWRNQIAMAKPIFGTTATQAAALFEVLGEAVAKDFYLGLKANGVKLLPGNKHVAEAVGRGEVAIGWTDTDDALGELEQGRSIAIIYPDRTGHHQYPKLGTLYIPNTVAVIKGCPNPVGAKALVDFLLSEKVEGSLARSAAHQIPLNPRVQVQLPAGLETAKMVKPMEVDWNRAADLWDASQKFLIEQFTK